MRRLNETTRLRFLNSAINSPENRIVALRLGGGAIPQPDPLPPLPSMVEPPPRVGTKADLATGQKLFNGNCAHCHVNAGRGPVPDLRRSTPATHGAFQQTVRGGTLQPRVMPRWDDLLGEKEVDQIHAYLIDLAWQLYDSDKGR